MSTVTKRAYLKILPGGGGYIYETYKNVSCCPRRVCDVDWATH